MDLMWVFLIIVCTAWVIPATAKILASNWRKARESEQLAVLKQGMIERGMSAEDIERVINAGRPDRRSDPEREMATDSV